MMYFSTNDAQPISLKLLEARGSGMLPSKKSQECISPPLMHCLPTPTLSWHAACGFLNLPVHMMQSFWAKKRNGYRRALPSINTLLLFRGVSA